MGLHPSRAAGGAGYGPRGVCSFNRVQVGYIAPTSREVRLAMDAGVSLWTSDLGGVAGGRPRPRAGAVGATVGRPGGD